jgi:hypothetical protein
MRTSEGALSRQPTSYLQEPTGITCSCIKLPSTSASPRGDDDSSPSFRPQECTTNRLEILHSKIAGRGVSSAKHFPGVSPIQAQGFLIPIALSSHHDCASARGQRDTPYLTHWMPSTPELTAGGTSMRYTLPIVRSGSHKQPQDFGFVIYFRSSSAVETLGRGASPTSSKGSRL